MMRWAKYSARMAEPDRLTNSPRSRRASDWHSLAPPANLPTISPAMPRENGRLHSQSVTQACRGSDTKKIRSNLRGRWKHNLKHQ